MKRKNEDRKVMRATERRLLDEKDFDYELKAIRKRVMERLKLKHQLVSRHEIMAVLHEEVCELRSTVNDSETHPMRVHDDLVGVAVAAVWALASSRKGLDW